MSAAAPESAERSAWELPELLGLTADLDRLHDFIGEWIDECDTEVPWTREEGEDDSTSVSGKEPHR